MEKIYARKQIFVGISGVIYFIFAFLYWLYMNDPFDYIIIGELILMGIFFFFKGFRFFMYIQFLDKNISIHHSFRTSTIFLKDILAIEFKRGGYVLNLKTSKKSFVSVTFTK